jgi:hypothetical protein
VPKPLKPLGSAVCPKVKEVEATGAAVVPKALDPKGEEVKLFVEPPPNAEVGVVVAPNPPNAFPPPTVSPNTKPVVVGAAGVVPNENPVTGAPNPGVAVNAGVAEVAPKAGVVVAPKAGVVVAPKAEVVVAPKAGDVDAPKAGALLAPNAGAAEFPKTNMLESSLAGAVVEGASVGAPNAKDPVVAANLKSVDAGFVSKENPVFAGVAGVAEGARVAEKREATVFSSFLSPPNVKLLESPKVGVVAEKVGVISAGFSRVVAPNSGFTDVLNVNPVFSSYKSKRYC